MGDDELLAIGLFIMLVMQSSPDWGAGWTWPVPDRPGVPAAISQEFKRGPHYGVDIMYREGVGWSAPIGTPVLAARDGVVWSVGETARGRSVVIDHGAPWATFYQHLASVKVVKGQLVRAGEEIGTMGADPTDAQGLRHLHFATWYKGHGDSGSVDPAKAMASWRRVLWT